jgi:septal ring factor EnvC (AmiA/AmiB activator)
MTKRTGKMYDAKDEPALREKLEKAKTRRAELEDMVNQRESELDALKEQLKGETEFAAELHAVLKYGLGAKDVSL